MNFQLENKNVYASDAGQGIDQNKETIVFLHGSGLSHIVWSLTEQFFSNNNFNVLSIDLPGHGNSDGPCLDSIEKIADWLEQVFNKLNLNNLILILQDKRKTSDIQSIPLKFGLNKGLLYINRIPVYQFPTKL